MGRRKSVEEYADEIRQRREEDDDAEPADREELPFQMLSDHEQQQVNALFDLLHEHGYLTSGEWHVTGGSPGEIKQITITANLPPDPEDD